MNRLRSDREARFRALYADTYVDVLRFVSRREGAGEAEDVVSEAFLVAWRRLDDAPHEQSDLRAWIFGIARNCLLNARRGADRRAALAVRLVSDAAGGGLTVRDQAEAVTRRLDLAAAWALLSPRHQESLTLAVLDGLTSTQAAHLLGISPTSYRLRVMRARSALRRHLDRRDSWSSGDPAPTCLKETLS